MLSLSLLIWLTTAVVGFAAFAALTAWLAPVLRRHGATTLPGPDNCGRALPRGGGLSIVVVTAAAGLITAFVFPASELSIAACLMPSLGIAAVSLRDDFRPLPATLRLAVHIAAATALVYVAGPLRGVTIGGAAAPATGAAAWPLSILWLVGMTNAFNFMNGIDGIAGITAGSAGFTLACAVCAAGCG